MIPTPSDPRAWRRFWLSSPPLCSDSLSPAVFVVGKRTNDTHRTREEEEEMSARERSIKKKDTHNMRNQKKTRVPPTKKYAKVYLVRLLELFLLRVGELLFLLRLFVDGHFYYYRVCVRVCVR